MLPGLEQMILQCAPQVAPSTLLAIIQVESSGNPWALNVNGKQRLTRQPGSREEAVAWARWLIERGHSVDLGLTQVNSRHLRRFGLTAESLLEPCTNIAAGAWILTENYSAASRKYNDDQEALRAALSAYNTGNHQAGIKNGYVGKVNRAAQRQASYSLPMAPPLAVR
jgi:type IV secretion system protein VirB1